MAAKRERHAQLPVRVLESEAHTTLGHYERSVLAALCAAYTGHNNGSLALTSGQAADKYGIRGKNRFYKALRELGRRGLIRCTYKGKLRQYDDKHSPSRFALSFRPQNENAVYNVKAETQPRNTFEFWTEKKNRKPGPAPGYGNPLHRTHPQVRDKPLPYPPVGTAPVPTHGSPIRISPPGGNESGEGDQAAKPVPRRAANA